MQYLIDWRTRYLFNQAQNVQYICTGWCLCEEATSTDHTQPYSAEAPESIERNALIIRLHQTIFFQLYLL